MTLLGWLDGPHTPSTRPSSSLPVRALLPPSSRSWRSRLLPPLAPLGGKPTGGNDGVDGDSGDTDDTGSGESDGEDGDEGEDAADGRVVAGSPAARSRGTHLSTRQRRHDEPSDAGFLWSLYLPPLPVERFGKRRAA